MFCREYGLEFELSADLHYVYYSNSTMVWCPVCLSHGRRALHLVMDTWNDKADAVTSRAGSV